MNCIFKYIDDVIFKIKDSVTEYIMIKRFKIGMKKHFKECKKKNIPIAKYDKISKKAYLEYPNGDKYYIDINDIAE